jgi:uncharacterized surface protein with fasciclin (FAS1) repeats
MNKYFPLLPLALLLCLAACDKAGLPAYTHVPLPAPDSAGDVRAVLAGSSFTLFSQAAARAGLDSLLPATGEYTLFAPVDSAMMSAGLTATVIASLPLDSLQRIVLYHVTRGVYSPAALTASICSIQAPTLRQDFSYNNLQAQVFIYQQPLFLKITGSLYVNGEAANNPGDTALIANNGYIYPVRAVLQAPTLSLWGILQQRPELSMFLTALRLDDSIYHADGYTSPGSQPVIYLDSVFFNSIYYINQTYLIGGSTGNPPATMYTVFAPTNAAFAAAGFTSADDLRAYANRSFVGSIDYSYTFNYTALDSVLKQHLIGNSDYSFTNLSLYNDLLFNPDINSGQFNVFFPYIGQQGGGQAYSSSVHPLFSNKNNTAYVQWSDSSSVPAAPLPADKSRHFMAQNGVIYETDQLFYPHN